MQAENPQDAHGDGEGYPRNHDKLADRLHNMRTSSICPDEKQIRIAGDDGAPMRPLHSGLGISKIKVELDDLR